MRKGHLSGLSRKLNTFAGKWTHSDWAIWVEFNKGVSYKAGYWKTTGDRVAPGNTKHLGVYRCQSERKQLCGVGCQKAHLPGRDTASCWDPAKRDRRVWIPRPYSPLALQPPAGAAFGWIQWDIRGKLWDSACMSAFRVQSRMMTGGSEGQMEAIQCKWPDQ